MGKIKAYLKVRDLGQKIKGTLLSIKEVITRRGVYRLERK